MEKVNTEDKKILDVCCAGRMFWFNKNHPLAIYNDIRNDGEIKLAGGNGRKITIRPTTQQDFRSLSFKDDSFRLVVFDPPHMKRLGKNSWMCQKYGVLFPTWETDLKEGFDECMRVLEPYGILIFKWNEAQITLNKILEIIKVEPLFGHTSGKHGKTIWLCFMKLPDNQ